MFRVGFCPRATFRSLQLPSRRPLSLTFCVEIFDVKGFFDALNVAVCALASVQLIDFAPVTYDSRAQKIPSAFVPIANPRTHFNNVIHYIRGQRVETNDRFVSHRR